MTSSSFEKKPSFLKNCLKKMINLESIEITRKGYVYGGIMCVLGQIENLKLSKFYIESFYSSVKEYWKIPYPEIDSLYVDFNYGKYVIKNEYIEDRRKKFIKQIILYGCKCLYIGYKKIILVDRAIEFIKQLTNIINECHDSLINVKEIYLNYYISDYFKNNGAVIQDVLFFVQSCNKKKILVCIDRNVIKYTFDKRRMLINPPNIHFKIL